LTSSSEESDDSFARLLEIPGTAGTAIPNFCLFYESSDEEDEECDFLPPIPGIPGTFLFKPIFTSISGFDPFTPDKLRPILAGF